MADCDRILPHIKPGWMGVEIGVSHGHSALALMEHGVRFLYLVDPWEDYDDYLEGKRGGEAWESIYREAMDRLSPFAGRHAHLRMTSAEAAQYIPPVDFVWVDGNHRYEFVKSDLDLYWPKIRPGGILCGHDYTDNADTCQVKRAVDEFAAAHGLAVEVHPPCWVIRK